MDDTELLGESAGGGDNRSSGDPVSDSQPSSYPPHPILSALTDQIFVVDRQGRHLFANDAGAAALQCTPGDIFGKTGSELGLPADLVTMIEDSCAHAFTSGQIVREMAILDVAGSPRELAFTFSPIPETNTSHPEALVVSIRDSAQDREAVEELWSRVHQLHHIIDAAPTLIAYIDRDERYLFSNKSYAAWFGKAPRDIYGMRVEEVVPEVLYAQLREHIQAALRGENAAYERQWQALDGEMRTLHAVYVPEFDGAGTVRGFVAVVNDITDRAKISEALRQSEHQYRLLAETIPHIVWMADADGMMQYMNHHWTDYTGYAFEPSDDRTSINAFVLPEDLPAINFAWRTAGESLSSFRHPFRLRGADGAYRWFLVHGSPLIDDHGNITRWFGTATDIHEQQLAADEQLFLTDLVDRLRRHSSDPEELLWQVVNAVGRHLKVARCTYAEVDIARDLMYGYRDYHDGYAIGVQGEAPLSSFGPAALDMLMSGKTSVNPNVATSPFIAGGYSKTLLQLGVHAYVSIPMLKDGLPVSALSVFSSVPRDWTPREVSLLEEVAERTWFAVENARLNRAAQDELLERQRAQEQLEASYAREFLLNQISQAARTSSDPDIVQAKTLETLGQGMNVDRAFLSFVDAAHDLIRTGGDWRAEGLHSVAGEYVLSRHKAVLDEIYRERSTIAVGDLQRSGLTLETAERFQKAGTHSFISVPFFDDDRLTAFFTVAMSTAQRSWTRDEISIVETAATQVRLAVESARIHQREHTIASTLQEALQPPIPSDVLGLDVGSYYRAALQESRIGGDFYDLFAIGDHTHAVIIGDVSGKGLAAAAQVATVRNMLRCVLYGKQNLAKAITSLNEMLTTRDLLAGFVTLFVGVYHTETGILNYISCGHEPALLRRAETGATEALDSIAPPLGIAETSIYEELTARLRPGDALVLYTDGISEAGVTRQDLLNTQGIIRIINSAPEGADADAIAKRIVAGAEEHSQGRQRDDICLLTLVARTPSA
ncbi:MAG: SpoIIE family protein phosphatase [Capsulimonas sp.]|uniref:SpoIIE family protein phosphatase n=1 Tax=Capsulimonas sp. TaxID=2494211 RepID=UPI0032660FB0